jgi:hypothetical protein
MTTLLSLTNSDSEHLRLLIKDVLLEIVHTDREFVQQLVEELREELERPTPESSDPNESFDAFSIVGLFSAEPDFAERSEEMLHAQFDLGQ